MGGKTIQWFPGHMAKTKRIIRENLSSVDIILELLDARIPKSSKNPDIEGLVYPKPILIVLNKCSLADPGGNRKWEEYFLNRGRTVLLTDCVTGQGLDRIGPAIRQTLREKIDRNTEKGMAGRPLRAMVLGIPNVGKSFLINRLCGYKKARVEDRPGVTREKQWIKTEIGIELLDMPGVLWPKFSDPLVGENLAITGAIKDSILQTEEIAVALCGRLRDHFPRLLSERYRIPEETVRELEPYGLFCEIGRKRGFLIKGGEIDEQRCAAILLDEFRGAKIGRITLE